MTRILDTLVKNSKKAVDSGIYDIGESLKHSNQDILDLLQGGGRMALITEIKFSSPSLGRIRDPSDAAGIAESMIHAGASAVSVLTQPYLFGGSPEYLMDVRRKIDAPVLMKDIVIDRRQVDAAAKMGADMLLFIQSVFGDDPDSLNDMIKYAQERGIRTILEVHTSVEMGRALETRADIIGINNRNLDTMEIDIGTTGRLLAETRDIEKPVISESGIETPDDMVRIRGTGVSGTLVGSSIMSCDDIAGRVRELVAAS